MNKLGEIDLDEEDRNKIIYSYHSKNPYALAYLAEKSVAEFYIRNGFEVEQPDSNGTRGAIDLIVKKCGEVIAIEIKSFSSQTVLFSMRNRLFSAVKQIERLIEQENIEQGKVIAVVRGDIDEVLTPQVKGVLNLVKDKVNPKITIDIGFVDIDDNFELIDL
ncbi:MAG: hypothetical protein RSB02_06430 [Anaerovoracaceae bacterium]